MTLFDRYVIGLFVKIMLVCYCSLAGLYLIIDIFNNLDEFVELGKRQGSMGQFLLHYYGPRLIGLFCEVSGLLYLLAAICTLTRLYGTHELAAVQAAGISIRRVAKPLVVLTLILCFGSLFCREWILPKFRETLTANAQQLLKNEPQSMISQIDYDSLVMIRGLSIDPKTGEIDQPDFLLPHDWQTLDAANQTTAINPAISKQQTKNFSASTRSRSLSPSNTTDKKNRTSKPIVPGNQIVARRAFWQPPTDQLPGGFLLDGVHQPASIATQASVVQDGKTRLYGPADHSWLKSDQCFIPTGIPVQQLVHGVDWFRSASLSELITVNQSGSVRLPSIHRIEMHWRLLRPFLDFSVLLIGLPLVLRREGQKLVVAAAYCGFLMIGVQLLVMVCQFLGAQQILKPTAFAAWLPILIVFPISVWFYQRFDH